MTPAALLALAQIGEPLANAIDKLLHEDPRLSKVPHKHLAIGVLLYGVGLANFTKLSMEEMVSLVCFFYQQVEAKEEAAEETPPEKVN